MARTVNRLSARAVATVTKPGRHADGAGLYLHVDRAGAKRWVFVFQWAGARKEMGLGSLKAIPLASARELAAEAREDVARGLNPIEKRREARAAEAPTFGEAARDFVEAQTPGWKSSKHAKQWSATLDTHAAPLVPVPVNKVTTQHILKVLQPIWTKIPETADRVRGRIERVLDAERAKGNIGGAWENPARWRGHLKLLLPPRQKLSRGHHPAMPYNDLPEFMVDLRAREAMAARALEFTILTVARTNEALGALKGEFDLEAATWTVPAERMKASREHVVPLAAAAVDLVRGLIETAAVVGDTSAYLFPGAKSGRPLSNMSMDMLLRRMDRDQFTVHGFRSTFRDWAFELTETPSEIVETALAHTVGTKTERAYRRGSALDRRRRLMEAWARFCDGKGADIVQLGGQGAGVG